MEGRNNDTIKDRPLIFLWKYIKHNEKGLYNYKINPLKYIINT